RQWQLLLAGAFGANRFGGGSGSAIVRPGGPDQYGTAGKAGRPAGRPDGANQSGQRTGPDGERTDGRLGTSKSAPRRVEYSGRAHGSLQSPPFRQPVSNRIPTGVSRAGLDQCADDRRGPLQAAQ